MNESEKQEKLDRAIRMLLDLSHHVTIIKHAPGKIKLRISLSGLRPLLRNIKAFSPSDADAAKEILPGLHHVQVLPLSRSAIITYDHVLIPHDLWQGLFGPKNERHPEAVIEERLRKLLLA